MFVRYDLTLTLILFVEFISSFMLLLFRDKARMLGEGDHSGPMFSDAVVHVAVSYARALLIAEAGGADEASAQLEQCTDRSLGQKTLKRLAMEKCCPFTDRLQNETACAGLEDEFFILRYLSRYGERISFTEFVRWLRVNIVETASTLNAHVSERTFVSGIMLFVRYLAASRWEREQHHQERDPNAFMTVFQERPGFDVSKVAIRCIHMTSNFGDGRTFEGLTTEDLFYHNHVLKSLRFDVVETSPVDYVCTIERLTAPSQDETYALAHACMIMLSKLVESPLLFYCGTAARACAVIVIATLRDHGLFHPLWVENWPLHLLQGLELLSPTPRAPEA